MNQNQPPQDSNPQNDNSSLEDLRKQSIKNASKTLKIIILALIFILVVVPLLMFLMVGLIALAAN